MSRLVEGKEGGDDDAVGGYQTGFSSGLSKPANAGTQKCSPSTVGRKTRRNPLLSDERERKSIHVLMKEGNGGCGRVADAGDSTSTPGDEDGAIGKWPSSGVNGGDEYTLLALQRKKKAEYPMWTISLSSFLDINIVQTHEEYRSQGRLKEHVGGDKDFVIFVSHQWLSDRHPDPRGTQLRVLQQALKNLLRGSLKNECESASSTSSGEAKEWRYSANLENTYVWYDYISVPQQNAGAYEGGCYHPNTYGSECTNAHSVAAIRSIPCYVDQASCVLICTPPLPHEDRKDAKTGEPEMCDFDSWANRGWCVFECFSALMKLDVADKCPVVAVLSPDHIFECDVLKLMAYHTKHLRFTCCELQKRLFNRANCTNRCDKKMVISIMNQQLKRKLRFLSQQGMRNSKLSRTLKALTPYFLSVFSRSPSFTPRPSLPLVSVRTSLSMLPDRRH